MKMRDVAIISAVSFALLLLLEAACYLVYSSRFGFHMPTYFGGAPLFSGQVSDAFDFDPLTLYSHKELPRTKDLFAKYKLTVPLKGKEIRVFIVGGSTVANERKPPGDRISDHIQNRLNKRYGNVRVYNFGVPSYISYNELTLIFSKLIYLQPDLIIVYNGANDAHYASVADQKHWAPNTTELSKNWHIRFEKDLNKQLSVRERLSYLIRGVSYTLALLYQFKMDIQQVKTYTDESLTAEEVSAKLSVGRDEQCLKQSLNAQFKEMYHDSFFANKATFNSTAIDAYFNNTTAIKDLLARNKIAFLHVLQPVAISKKILFPCERSSIEMNNKKFENYSLVFLETYNAMRERLKKLPDSRSQRFKRLDLSRFTDDRKEYLYDDIVHAYSKGILTKIVGTKIGDTVIEYGFLDQ